MLTNRAFAGNGITQHQRRHARKLVLIDGECAQRRRGQLRNRLIVNADHADIARHQHANRIERLQLAFGNMLKNKQNQIAQTSLRPYYILNIFEKKQENLKNLSLRLDSVSIDSVLSRGFAWVRDNRRQTVYSVAQAQKSPSLEIRFIDGSIKTKTERKKNDTLQGDLFDLFSDGAAPCRD